MKLNHHWHSVPLLLNHWTVKTELYPALHVYILPNDPRTKKNCLLNTNEVRAILQPHVLEFEQVVFPINRLLFFIIQFENSACFAIIYFNFRTYFFWDFFKQTLCTNIFFGCSTIHFLQLHLIKLELEYSSWWGCHRALLAWNMFRLCLDWTDTVLTACLLLEYIFRSECWKSVYVKNDEVLKGMVTDVLRSL